MIANIYKPSFGDCSNNGISSRNYCIVVISKEQEETKSICHKDDATRTAKFIYVGF